MSTCKLCGEEYSGGNWGFCSKCRFNHEDKPDSTNTKIKIKKKNKPLTFHFQDIDLPNNDFEKIPNKCKVCGKDMPIEVEKRKGRTCSSCFKKIQNEKYKVKKEISVESYFKRILKEIPKRNRDCDITLDQLLSLYDSQKGLCAITGLPLEVGNKRLDTGGMSPFSISIDRIDNDGNYTINNIWLICLSVNQFKSVHSLGDVFHIAKKICENNLILVNQVF